MTDPLPPLPATAAPAEVVAALDALAAGQWVATDADETLWAGDVGDEVVLLASRGVAPWPAGSADFAAYQAHMAGEGYADACRQCAVTLAAVAAEPARAALQPHLDRVPSRQWLVDALLRAQDRGVQVWIVSASPRPVVQWTAVPRGFRADRVIGIDAVDGKAVEPAPVGHGKVAAWRQLGLPAPDVALGDSKWDGPLLASARRGFLLAKASAERQGGA